MNLNTTRTLMDLTKYGQINSHDLDCSFFSQLPPRIKQVLLLELAIDDEDNFINGEALILTNYKKGKF